MNCHRFEPKPARLFAATALMSTLAVGAASAQQAPVSQGNAGSSEVFLSDIVVTANRQTDTVSRVPLSISAVTQRSLDQQGIKSVADLQRIVPALAVSSPGGGATNFTIRGIIANSGAPTTGVYIDDTPVQKRFAVGSQVRNGSPTPPLFDLERIEVLRGPQGTLYGGSSQGGTIRFITPEPSLTRYSGYMRTELSQIQHGDPSYEGGIALGGPIIKDKLGFRASIFGRKTGGYIDMLDPYQNGAIRFENANNREATAGRIAIRWAPTEQSLITLTHFRTRQSDFGGPDSYNTVIGGPNQTFTTTQQCFDTSRTVLTGTSPTTAVTCPAAVAPLTANIFRRAAVTYGPYNYLNDQSNIVQQWPVYAANTFNMTDLTIEYDFPGFTAKSITSLFYDKIKGSQGDGSLTVGSNQRLQGYPATATTFATGFPFNALEPFQDIPGGFVEGFYSVNARHGTTQEVRLASTGDGMPLSWVVGGYFSQINGHVNLRASENLEVTNRLLFGLRDDQRFVETLPDGSRRAIPQINGLVFLRDQLLSDTELAGFGEANYWITKRIKVTAGVRFSSVKFKYSAVQYGAQAGLVIPSTFNGGLADGRQSASPITPRFGLQYQINDANMVYVSASKGFRSGGVNAPLANTCSPGLATLGLTVRDIPDTYGPDTVWSYEGGAKLKLFQNRLQINSSVFRIDWNQVQLAVATPGCGPTYNRNAGTARSQGFDVQGQARVARGLVVSFSAGYTDAKYTQGATGPAPLNGSAAAPIVLAGQPLPVPKWQVNLGAQYDFDLSKIPFYVRADYQYTGKYVSGVPAGLPGYTPDTVQTGVVAQVNARVGGTFNGFDINLFMNNVFNSGDILSTTGGRGTCPLAEGAACVNYGTYTPFLSVTALRPREIGVQASRRF